jgi:hypothetical protein
MGVPRLAWTPPLGCGSESMGACTSLHDGAAERRIRKDPRRLHPLHRARVSSAVAAWVSIFDRKLSGLVSVPLSSTSHMCSNRTLPILNVRT